MNKPKSFLIYLFSFFFLSCPFYVKSADVSNSNSSYSDSNKTKVISIVDERSPFLPESLQREVQREKRIEPPPVSPLPPPPSQLIQMPFSVTNSTILNGQVDVKGIINERVVLVVSGKEYLVNDESWFDDCFVKYPRVYCGIAAEKFVKKEKNKQENENKNNKLEHKRGIKNEKKTKRLY